MAVFQMQQRHGEGELNARWRIMGANKKSGKSGRSHVSVEKEVPKERERDPTVGQGDNDRRENQTRGPRIGDCFEIK